MADRLLLESVVVADSYDVGNYAGTTINFGSAAISSQGQAFTGNGQSISTVQFYLVRTVSNNAPITVKIYAHSGTFGSSGIATGSPLATSMDVNYSTIPTSIGFVTFSFLNVNQITLVNGVNYVAMIEGVTEVCRAGTDVTAPTHGGNSVSFDGTYLSDNTADSIFSVNTSPVTIDKYLQEDGLSALIIESGVTVTPDTVDGVTTGTLPVLEFTGNQNDADDARYNINIDTVNTFDSTATVIDSYAGSSDAGGTFDNSGTGIRIMAQSVTGDGSILTAAKFTLNRGATGTTGDVTAVVYAHTGTFGTSSLGTGTVLATSGAILTSTLTTTPVDYTFNFTGINKITLVAGVKYVVGVSANNAAPGAGDFLQARIDNTSPTYSGNVTRFNESSSNWDSLNTWDLLFTLYSLGPLLSKTSGTDPGFLNTVTPADTDPFNTDEKISYTVQTALTAGTYYWRARALDPLGSNTYGAYSTTRSFTATASVATPRFRSLLGVGS